MAKLTNDELEQLRREHLALLEEIDEADEERRDVAAGWRERIKKMRLQERGVREKLQTGMAPAEQQSFEAPPAKREKKHTSATLDAKSLERVKELKRGRKVMLPDEGEIRTSETSEGGKGSGNDRQGKRIR